MDVHLCLEAHAFKTKSKSVMARMLLDGAEAEARAAAAAAGGEGEGEGGGGGGGLVVSPLAGKNPATGKLCLAPCVDGRIVTLNPADDAQMAA